MKFFIFYYQFIINKRYLFISKLTALWNFLKIIYESRLKVLQYALKIISVTFFRNGAARCVPLPVRLNKVVEFIILAEVPEVSLAFLSIFISLTIKQS